MQTNAFGGVHGQNQLLRELMQLARANPNQEDASGAASSAQPAAADQDQPGPSPAPSAAGSTPADLFSGSTLGALTSAQEGAGDWRQQMDADLANKMVGKLDTDGDGSLSLSEVETSLGVSGGAPSTTDPTAVASSTTAQDKLSAAFAQVDTDGNGQLSTDELTTALNQSPVHHGWGHRHHHGAPSDAVAAGGGAASPATTATTASDATSTDSAAAASGPSNADIIQAMQAFETRIQQQLASVEALLQPPGATGVTA